MENSIPNSVDRRVFWRYVSRKIHHMIHQYHIMGVINILFEEILKDLKENEEIKIYNFGTLKFKKTKPRNYFDINNKKIMLSKGYRTMTFTLSPKIRKKICNNLDIDKSFGDN